MGWLQENMGYIILFIVVALVILGVVGFFSGKIPAILDAVRSVIGA